MPDNIRLEKVDYNNYEELIELQVKDSQRGFVSSNIKSLAEAYATIASGGVALPFGIYHGDIPIGFIMFGYCATLDDVHLFYDGYRVETADFMIGSYYIWRFMIDQRYQGKGYGKEAFRLALDYIRSFPCGSAKCCYLDYNPDNEAARKFYRSFGFEEYPEMKKGWDETAAILEL